MFSTCIHLAHRSDLAGSSQGHEETFVLRFFGMGEQPERFVCFSDLNTLPHSKRNNQTSELQKGSGGTGRNMEWDCQPAHDTQIMPRTSTQPIKSHLGFCLLFLVTWYPFLCLHYKNVGQRQQGKHFSVLVGDHAGDGNHTEG